MSFGPWAIVLPSSSARTLPAGDNIGDVDVDVDDDDDDDWDYLSCHAFCKFHILRFLARPLLPFPCLHAWAAYSVPAGRLSLSPASYSNIHSRHATSCFRAVLVHARFNL
ncbi:uncharacterized protein K489DRAFT_383084 [Dissoconium aciculare CBS 342.82]|uniref:Uncharacterized protein n=1 Tax=Dissoconium aciculare CBS 342.82 TaxID=1314786 RepID=A0A6J3LYA8_9PEZI|nr:uncharacterized protein K489DRAFT_383084 [Dissoconium aciculare CBS 342.82]KAF1820289.1 hypothetical protein K489DRAFT_383084 [Dissoconium aciculare CBS 342.82]